MIFIDALVVKVRDQNVVRNKACHVVIGVDTDGVKHVLGLWVQQQEGARFWNQGRRAGQGTPSGPPPAPSRGRRSVSRLPVVRPQPPRCSSSVPDPSSTSRPDPSRPGRDVVERTCLRAGLPHVSPHRLRHALPGELLRQGAGLIAISQVLRHRDLATTAIYAKVDLVALQRVAQPWPGTDR